MVWMSEIYLFFWWFEVVFESCLHVRWRIFTCFLCDSEMIFEWVCVTDGVWPIFVRFCVIVDLFCVVFVWWGGFRMTFERFFRDVYEIFCRVFQQFVWFCVMEWFLNHVRIVFKWFFKSVCVMEWFWMVFESCLCDGVVWTFNGFAFLENLETSRKNSKTSSTQTKFHNNCDLQSQQNHSKMLSFFYHTQNREFFNVKTMRIQRKLWKWKLLSSSNVNNLRQDISRNGMAGVTSLYRVIPHHAPSKRSLRWPVHEAS